MSKTGVFASPVVKVLNAHIKSAGLSGVKLDVILLAMNPNPASLPATRIIYTLTKASDGAVLADGVSRQKVTLDAAGETHITIPMEFKYWGLGAAGKSLVTRGQTTIKVAGEITFEAPMAPGGTATSQFEDEVRVNMEDMVGS